jgi:hypothetical protein
MVAERRHLYFHEGVKGQRVQDVVKLGRAIYPKDADVFELASHAPEVFPFPRILQLFRALMFQAIQGRHLAWVGVAGDADRHLDVKKHLYHLDFRWA